MNLNRRICLTTFLSFTLFISFFTGCQEPDYSEFTGKNNNATFDFPYTGTESATEKIYPIEVTLVSWTSATSPFVFEQAISFAGTTKVLSYLLDTIFGKVLVFPVSMKADSTEKAKQFLKLKEIKFEWTIKEEDKEPIDGEYAKAGENFAFLYGSEAYKNGSYLNSGIAPGELGFFAWSVDSALLAILKESVDSNKEGYTGTKITTLKTASATLEIGSEDSRQPLGRLIPTVLAITTVSGDSTILPFTLYNSSATSVMLKHTPNQGNVLFLYEKTGDKIIPKLFKAIRFDTDTFSGENYIVPAETEATLNVKIKTDTMNKIKVTNAALFLDFADILP